MKLGGLPKTLPFILSDNNYLYNSEIKNSSHTPIRRLWMKRLGADGNYESSWQEIDDKKIISWGSISYGVDDKKINYFDQSGVTIKADNSDGYFSDETYYNSFWSGFISPYRTLVKIEAGLEVTDENGCAGEVPSISSLFYGLLTDELDVSYENVVSMPARALTSVFAEIPANRLPLNTMSTQTASEIVTLVKNYQDSSGTFLFRNFFSAGAWNIETTTSRHGSLVTTTAVDDFTCLTLIERLAETEGMIFYVSRN